MKISTKGRYALRMMLDLAKNGQEGYVSLRDVSERQDVTVKYLEQIATALSRAGYIHSQRGNSGGYRLTREPDGYRVYDILRVTEEDLAPVACLSEGAKPCERAAECRTLAMWQKFYELTRDYFSGVTLADLMRTDSADMYVI